LKIKYENNADINGERLYIKHADEGEMYCNAIYSEVNGTKIWNNITIPNNQQSLNFTDTWRSKQYHATDKKLPAIIMRIAIKKIGGNKLTKSLPIENVDASNAYRKKTKYIKNRPFSPKFYTGYYKVYRKADFNLFLGCDLSRNITLF
jgi:hypothetical protein